MTFRIYNRVTPPDSLCLSDLVSKPSEEKVCLLTFGGGGVAYRAACNALAFEAAETGWFDVITNLTDQSDDCLVKAMYDEHGKFIADNCRGHGYWVWKSFLLSRYIRDLKHGDILVYIDSGCELSRLGSKVWHVYLNQVRVSGGLFFSLPFLEQEWTKAVCASELGATALELSTPQIQATWFMLSVCEHTKGLIDLWYRRCIEHDYLMLRDKDDSLIECVSFIDHRHDQSILSLLVKRTRYKVIPWQDRYAPWLYIKNNWVLLYPVHATRCLIRRRVALLADVSEELDCNVALTRTSYRQRVKMFARMYTVNVLCFIQKLRDTFVS